MIRKSVILALFISSYASIILAQISNNSVSMTSNTMPITTLSSIILSSTSSGNISIPFVSTAVSARSQKGITIVAPTAPMLPNPTSQPEVAGEYKLRIKTITGPKHFNGQYLAGWTVTPNSSADAVFTKNKAFGAKFFLNGTVEQADFGTPAVQWSMIIIYDFIDAEWYPVSLRAPSGNKFGTFWLNSTGLQWTPNETPPPHDSGVGTDLDAYFGGWFVCDWWHSLPQLFYRVGYFDLEATKMPSSCALVHLLPEYFK